MKLRDRAAIALVATLAWGQCCAAVEAPGTGSEACRAPVRIAELGSDGRIDAKWNAATQTIAYGRMEKVMNVDGSDKRRLTFMNQRGHAQSANRFRLAGAVSFVSDTAFFGDVLTQSLGLAGKIVRVDCR